MKAIAKWVGISFYNFALACSEGWIDLEAITVAYRKSLAINGRTSLTNKWAEFKKTRKYSYYHSLGNNQLQEL